MFSLSWPNIRDKPTIPRHLPQHLILFRIDLKLPGNYQIVNDNHLNFTDFDAIGPWPLSFSRGNFHETWNYSGRPSSRSRRCRFTCFLGGRGVVIWVFNPTKAVYLGIFWGLVRVLTLGERRSESGNLKIKAPPRCQKPYVKCEGWNQIFGTFFFRWWHSAFYTENLCLTLTKWQLIGGQSPIFR
jgi:hypothetical protein